MMANRHSGHVQNLLVMKLREMETRGEASVTVNDVEVAGMTQHDLITWYFDYQVQRWAWLEHITNAITGQWLCTRI